MLKKAACAFAVFVVFSISVSLVTRFIWEAWEGQRIQRDVNAFAFSADGKTLITESNDAFRVQSWPERDTLQTTPKAPGQRLYLGGSNGWRTWETDSGEEIVRMRDGKRIKLPSDDRFRTTLWLINSDGTVLITKNIVQNRYDVWKIRHGAVLPADISLDNGIVAIQPDGRVIALLGEGHIRLFSTEDGRLLKRLPVSQYPGSQMIFSPDGSLLAVEEGFTKGQISIWDTSTGTVVKTVSGDFRNVTKLVFSPDGRFLAAAEDSYGKSRFGIHDTYVFVWDISSGAQIQKLKHPEPVDDIAFHPDNTSIAVLDIYYVLWFWKL